MPVTREQDPAEASARGKQVSEPPLHCLRRSLVGVRYEFLKTAAFSAVFIASLCMIAGGAGLLAPDNQFYADARLALHGLAGNAQSGAETLSGQIQVAAASVAHGVSDRVSGAIATRDDGAAPAAAPAAIAKPAAVAANPPAGRIAPAAHKKLAHHRHRGAVHPAPAVVAAAAPAPQQSAAWSLDGIGDQLGDEFAKLYYGVVNFCAAGFAPAGNAGRNALDSFTRMIGLDSEPASFDPSHPERIFEILTSTSTLIMGLGFILFLIITGVFAMSVKDALRDMGRRLRVRRSGGYA